MSDVRRKKQQEKDDHFVTLKNGYDALLIVAYIYVISASKHGPCC
jgi:hypothetical protein